MADGTRKFLRWRTVWIPLAGVVVSALAILIKILWPIVFPPEPPRPPEYTLSVDPMSATIQHGGVLHATIQVTGTGGYRHAVSLTTANLPAGVVATFSSPSGVAQPPYSSTMTISTQQSVGPGEYVITVVGRGADGLERNCKYGLLITDGVTTVTGQTTPISEKTEKKPPETPPPPYEVKIGSPRSGQVVPVNVRAEGTVSGPVPDGWYLWLVINPEKAPGLWWPQGGQIQPHDGQWSASAGLGGPQDAHTQFEIAVVLTNEQANEHYLEYLRRGVSGDYPGEPLPRGATIKARVSVKRE